MKRILFTLALLLTFTSVNIAYSEQIDMENQALYLVHFGRGDDENSVGLNDFYTFLNSVLANTDTTGLTVIDSQGYRFNDQHVQRENTTIIEIVGDPSVVETKINDISQKYCDTFEAQKVEVFIVKVPHVKTSLFD